MDIVTFAVWWVMVKMLAISREPVCIVYLCGLPGIASIAK